MSGQQTQFGIGVGVTYGTADVVTKFYEIVKESFSGQYSRIQADGLSNALFDRADRFAVTNKGASGSFDVEVLTKNFGHLLKYMMGTVTTTGPTDTVAYTHVASPGNLFGKFLTMQVGRAQSNGTVIPWTYPSGKVMSFELSNSVDKLLVATLDMDFAAELCPSSPTGATSLATVVLPTGANILSYMGGQITIGGTVYNVSDISFKVDNALNDARYFIRRGQSKKEPNQDGVRKVTWSITIPYDDQVLWQAVSSATAAGSLVSISANWQDTTLMAGSAATYASFQVDIPLGRFDDGIPNVDGPGEIDITFTGVGLGDSTHDAIDLTYVTLDSTVL